MEFISEDIIFSTGKVLNYINKGIVGLSFTEDSFTVYEGYDSIMATENLTQDERIELADYMIKLWQQFKIQQQVAI